MLSYRHAFHAGNFADVHKHVVLTLLVQSFTRKATPFCYLDGHAGAGRYDLHSAAATKNREYERGVSRLWGATSAPALINTYLGAVRALNSLHGSGEQLRYYPGSPRLARHFLRPQDRMLLSELHPADIELLKREFAGDSLTTIRQLDAYQGLKALLPPKERRGLVLLDPPYELRNEYQRMVEGLITATKRFAQGVYALWYPIGNRATVTDFHRRIVATGLRKIYVSELCTQAPVTARHLNGSGMLIVNPPWQTEETLKVVMPWLWNELADAEQGNIRNEWLVPE